MNDNEPPQPFFNVPPVTQGAVAGLLAIHMAIAWFVDPVRQYWLFSHFGFVPAIYTGEVAAPLWQFAVSPFTYALLHGGWGHILVNAAMLAAFGAGIERWIGGGRMIVLFILCSLGAVFFHLLADMHSTHPVIGASGGISGLFAASLVMMRKSGFQDSRGLVLFALIWVACSVLFGWMGAPDGSPVAWIAHIGGFMAGFVFLPLVMKIPARA